MRFRLAATVWLLALLAACAPQTQRLGSIGGPRAEARWAFEDSDLPLDPGYRFGRLDNGLRYVIRQNATPAGTALVRMEIAAAALDEAENERGFAHFVEHMAFNGSTNVPEGEMIRLLERNGLAFGADTNASTGFETTTYALDLPRNDTALLDTALMLMRETASELSFSPAAVDRERGVVLSELRDRSTFQLRNSMEQTRFFHPDALYPRRFAIGTQETLANATAAALKAFWAREYVPAKATVIIIGDLDPAQAEAAIRARFGDWRPVPAAPQPSAGPVRSNAKGKTGITLDPALTERVTASRHSAWLDEKDTLAQRRENVLRQIGYGMINRRLQSLSRATDPPFRGAGFGTADVFKAGRTTNLIVDTVDAKWRRGLIAATLEYRKAFKFGFAAAEVAEQVANLRTQAEDAVASAATRSNGALAGSVFALLRDGQVPSAPQSMLDRFTAMIPEITPSRVMAALKREAVPLKQPLLRYQGKKPPAGGEKAIRQAWEEAMRMPIARPKDDGGAQFAYTSFGEPGRVTADDQEPLRDIRRLRFANGVMLNLRRTDLEQGRIHLDVRIDGGELLNTREKPFVTEMVPALPVGGLGKHSQDELQSILAGRTVGLGLGSSAETFTAGGQTTPRDLEIQLQLIAALITDPGYRSEGEVQYRLNINNFFAQLRATPTAALGNAMGGILSDNDPRFTLAAPEAYRKLTFAQLKTDIADRLARGAIEIGIVGDINEEQAIAAVARTFGALSPREQAFRAYDEQRQRPYTGNLAPRVIRHTGAKDQALLRLTWPTRDDSDPVETLGLGLIERIVRISLTDTLRERLGQAYSPSASSNPSSTWRGYGTFGMAASIAVDQIKPARRAIDALLVMLRSNPVAPDLLQRARQPMLEELDNALKSNRAWLGLAARAQSDPQRIARQATAKERLLALTTEDLLSLVRRYLPARKALEVLVLPEGVDEPDETDARPHGATR